MNPINPTYWTTAKVPIRYRKVIYGVHNCIKLRFISLFISLHSTQSSKFQFNTLLVTGAIEKTKNKKIK